jgi:hypothetical protein
VALRAALSAQMQDRLIKMPDRRRGLQAGVESSGGIYRPMTEYAADNLVGAGIGIEKQFGTDVTKKVGMEGQSYIGADGPRDLGTEERLILGATGASWK